MREENWNHDWKFWEEVNAFSLVWSVPEDAREITLPHDAMLERSARPDSPNGGTTGYRDGGNYVYVKRFFAPESWKHQTVSVKFDGIYRNALVYLNGQFLTAQPYGYSVFRAALNDHLRYGEENELRILVKNNAMPNSRWYSGSGIYRDVRLLTADTLYIPDGSLKITTEQLEASHSVLRVDFSVHNRRYTAENLAARIRILDPEGCCAAEIRLPLSLPGGKQETLSQRLMVPNPRPRSAENPRLYRCEVCLLQGEQACDPAETAFGIRTLTLDSIHGLRVNGETVKLRGACIHHDHGILGAATYYDAEYRRIQKLKEAGFNAIRMAHNPAAPALLRACDELGMYVMDEAFDMWSRPKKDNDHSLLLQDQWQRDIAAMAEKNYNHPSVILYSLGNEIPEIGSAQGAAFGREMARYLKGLDPTRYCLVSINGVFAAGDQVGRILADILCSGAHGETDGDVNDFMTAMDTHMDEIVQHPIISGLLENAAVGMDAVGYNYMTSRYASDAAAYPHRVLVGSETYPPDIARNWPLVKKLPSLIGDFTWTGWDYLGEAGLGIPAYAFGEGGFGAQYPCQLAYCGDLDITGFRRPQSYFREIVFERRTDPYIAVQRPDKYGQMLIKTPWILSDSISCWTYPGMEGKPVVVEVYAPGDAVELLCNGKSLGRQAAGEAAGFLARFETAYTPGCLEAVAYLNDIVIGRTRLETASGNGYLTVQAEPAVPGGEGLRFLNITHADEAGTTAPWIDGPVTVTNTENLQLLGFGSGDPKPLYNYLDTTVTTYNGRALLAVRKIDPALPAAVTLTSSHGTVTLTL